MRRWMNHFDMVRAVYVILTLTGLGKRCKSAAIQAVTSNYENKKNSLSPAMLLP